MDLKKIFQNKKNLSNALIAFAVAIVLLIVINSFSFSNGTKTPSAQNPQNAADAQNQQQIRDSDYAALLETKLQNMFAGVSGVGAVKVMVTLSASKESDIARDTTKSVAASSEKSAGAQKDSTDTKTDTKNVLNQSGAPIVLKENYPVVEGVLIVCQGGDRPDVKFNLTAAAAALLNIGADKVQVLKMRSGN